MTAVSPIPGEVRRSEVLRMADRYARKAQPARYATLFTFLGVFSIVGGLCLMLFR